MIDDHDTFRTTDTSTTTDDARTSDDHAALDGTGNGPDRRRFLGGVLGLEGQAVGSGQLQFELRHDDEPVWEPLPLDTEVIDS